MEPISENAYNHPDRKIRWLALGVLVIKLLLIPFVQVVDADAVTRTMLSEDWLKNPVWITNGVWGPFHFYLTGFVLSVWNNPVYAPVVLNSVLSAITLVPFYYFVKREFNSAGAFVASCFFAISPIIFRYSLMNMSEAPYLLLITLALNFLSKGFKSGTASGFLLAGLSISIASGFRFEAWFFIPLFTLAILLKKEKMNALLFFGFAMLYPLADMLTHFIQDHYSLSGFFSNYPWSLRPNGYFAPPHFEDYLRRLWFIPLCWFISLGPVAFITIREIALSRKKNHGLFWCAFLFWSFLILTEISAFKGAIILHTRFAATIALLSFPFIASYYKEISVKKIRMAVLFGVLTIGLTFIYNMGDIRPLPRLADQNGAQAAKIISKEIMPESGLIIDFWNWENTYYIGLQSKLAPHNIYMCSGDDKDKIQAETINTVLQNHPQGIILLVKNSLLWQNAVFSGNHLQFKFNNMPLNIQEIYSNDAVVVWKYWK